MSHDPSEVPPAPQGASSNDSKRPTAAGETDAALRSTDRPPWHRPITRAFLAFVAFGAGLRLLFAWVSGLSETDAPLRALLVFAGASLVLFLGAGVSAVLSRRSQIVMRFALALLIGALSVGVVALVVFLLDRSDGIDIQTASEVARPWFTGAGALLCASALTWGLGCAGSILADESS